jgi:hypothetical protein
MYRGKRERPLAVMVRDQLGEWLTDEQFAGAYGKRGKPAWPPSRLALVTIFQMAEEYSWMRPPSRSRLRTDRAAPRFGSAAVLQDRPGEGIPAQTRMTRLSSGRGHLSPRLSRNRA